MTTLTLAGADVRGYYHRLGIQLPNKSQLEASVRCFADPGSHRHEDRNPSCSINLVNGAWRCHGCGARGGAYDAALAKGHTPRSAIDLMIAHRLIERRARLRTAREVLQSAHQLSGQLRPVHPLGLAEPEPAPAQGLAVSDRDVARWHAGLSRRPRLIARLAHERGWRYETMCTLELGIDRGRITIPVRNAEGRLRGLLRYQTDPTARPKMLSALGSRLGLVPHPATETSQQILLVEGPPDMIAARSRGLPAIAVPGDHAWQPPWSRLLAGRDVTIVMDADTQGRAAAARISSTLNTHARVRVVDLDSARADGYDLTDWLIEHPEPVDLDTFRALPQMDLYGGSGR